VLSCSPGTGGRLGAHAGRRKHRSKKREGELESGRGLTATLTATRLHMASRSRTWARASTRKADLGVRQWTPRADLRIRRLGVRIPPGAPVFSLVNARTHEEPVPAVVHADCPGLRRRLLSRSAVVPGRLRHAKALRRAETPVGGAAWRASWTAGLTRSIRAERRRLQCRSTHGRP
jgi:hypothetical protein